MSENDELVVFAEDDPGDQFSAEKTPNKSFEEPFWHLLIVDDDPEVHSVTRLALSGFTFGGHRLKIDSALSAAEARDYLSKDTKYALALLDVVMETNQAGLDLAKWIREEAKNEHIRLVLRTGQPGEAPEREVINDYDINDYREKTELTANKLYTLVFASIRSYRDILALYNNKIGLEAVINSTNQIYAHKSLTDFTQGALQQLSALLHLDTGTLYSELHGIAATHHEDTSKILAATGRFSDLVDHQLTEALKVICRQELELILKDGGQLFGEDFFIGVYDSHMTHKHLLFLEGFAQLSELDKQLIKIFGHNLGVAFDSQAMFAEVETTQREMIYRLSEAVESRSKETSNHVKRMALSCRLIARKFGLSEHQIDTLYKAAPLHDIGKIAIPDHILNKPGKLDKDEWLRMQTHAQIGHDILASSELEVLKAGAIVAGHHHENWDGSGYPGGISGESIHIFGRIAAVADVFDALVNKRCYKESWPIEDTLDFFKQMRGVKFQPELVDLVFTHQQELMKIQQMYVD